MLRLHKHRLRSLLALLKCISVLFSLAFLRFFFFFLLFPIELEASLQLLTVLSAVDTQRGDRNTVALVGNLTARSVLTAMVSLASD